MCISQVNKKDKDGNDVLENGQPVVDYENSCFKGQYITASEKERKWLGLHNAFMHLLQDLCGLDEKTARNMINRCASRNSPGSPVTKQLLIAV